MSSTSELQSVGSIHEEGDSQSENTTPKRLKKSPRGTQSFELLSDDVQEEIECLYEFVPEVQQHFVVHSKIGEGTFSSVFLAKMRHYPDLDQLFALKHIIPTSHPSRIEGELHCLQEIGGQDNVMGVELCIRSKDHVVIVMPYFPHEKFQDYILKMHLSEVRDYMKNLLIALRRVHMFDIIHRDVKPSNFLWDRKTKRYALVDFGLAHKAPVTQKGKVTVSTNIQDKNSPQVSPSKRGVLSQQNQNNSVEENPSSKSQDGRHRNYTPPTPDFSNRAFTKRVKSPRRLLLAKRALMVKERETTHQRSKSSSAVLQGSSGMATCQCYGQPLVCTICTARSNQQAPRAGTPGFRAPEVLMKCPEQSTAVDIWSAGVIFLSLLSGRYPFFRANDDFTALAQIISIMGSKEVKDSAKSYGKNFICSPATAAVDLKTLCSKLRQGAPCKSSRSREDLELEKENIVNASWSRVPNSAYDLLKKLLDLDPFTRITAEKALEHPFFSENMIS